MFKRSINTISKAPHLSALFRHFSISVKAALRTVTLAKATLIVVKILRLTGQFITNIIIFL